MQVGCSLLLHQLVATPTQPQQSDALVKATLANVMLHRPINHVTLQGKSIHMMQQPMRRPFCMLLRCAAAVEQQANEPHGVQEGTVAALPHNQSLQQLDK